MRKLRNKEGVVVLEVAQEDGRHDVTSPMLRR